MKRYLLHMLVVTMTISLIGIVVVQLFWIRNAIEVKEAEYEKRIRESLNNIVKKIERKHAIIFISENLETVTIKRIGSSTPLDKKEFIEYFQGDSTVRVSVKDVDISTQSQTKFNIIASKPKAKGKYLQIIDTNTSGKNNKKIISSLQYATNDDNVIVVGHDTLLTNNQNSGVNNFSYTFSDMLIEYENRNNPIENKINIHNLDAIIQKEIIDKGLDIDFEYAIINNSKDSIEKSSKGFLKEYIPISFKSSLFPNDIVDKSIFLHVYLPNKNSFIYKSIAIMLLGSIFFTLIIIIIFFITIKITFRQKKISEIKSDFINNMTHEFKTPIATISLAADSIKSPKIIQHQDKVNHYIQIIKEENRRMNNQVESVLQMSLLEKERFKLNQSEQDLHVLIEKAVQNFNLKIRENTGNLNLELFAENPFAVADETHFLNIIHNLLDNAIKYSNTNPDIILKTYNKNGQIKIKVIDKGIGIRKDDLVRIFDKFYRVSTGNIHNVKGFGLGLSYVKAIISEFRGTIAASSEFGKGSQFEITLPIITVSNGK